MTPPSDIRRTVDAVFRMEAAKIIATLTRITRDVGLAEELAQDAVLAALEQWPTEGVPDKPGAWLTATAKHRAIDRMRRDRRMERGSDAVERRTAAPEGAEAIEDAADDQVRDDVLRLVFVACHPVLSPEARAALTLRLLGGLSTPEIARAYLVPEPTIGQRISRAKRTLGEAGVAFEVPRSDELRSRLGPVLEVLYLIFNEGYSATAGDDLLRPALCDEAMRLGRVLVGLVPDEPEAHGLLALMELTASRAAARTGPSGEAILLLDQDRTRWDRVLMARGLAALARTEELGGAGGPYALQAAIGACHARARTPDETDWSRIAALYGALFDRTGSPVVEINRAVAVAMAFGPDQGLRILDGLADDPALTGYHLLPAARGDLLEKLGRRDQARAEFERAASLTENARERAVLQARALANGDK